MNEVSLEFFDAYLQDSPGFGLDTEDFPELTIEMNAYAQP
jgi:hypothetical protein